MNILTDRLPDKDKFGRAIRTDFRYWIAFLACISDESLPQDMRVVKALELVYREIENERIGEHICGALEFIRGWHEAKEQVKENSNAVVDFEHDQHLIYAAFLQDYGIDLTRANMHYYLFMSLLFSVSQNTRFGEALYYRSVKIAPGCDKHTRKQIQEGKKIYAIKKAKVFDDLSEEEFLKEVKEQTKKLQKAAPPPA